jgi:DNA-dependent protein kinase catalytic subunit
MSLLDALLEVATAEIGSVQAVAIEGVSEYLAYSIKQSSARSMDLKNATSLFKRLYLLLIHSSSKKRIGGCAIFNRLYSVFREEDALVARFSFEILYHLCQCLKLSVSDSAAETQAQLAITHIKKIIIGKLELFNDSTMQAKPEVSDGTISGLIRFLLGESGAPLGVYSRICLSACLELLTASSKGKLIF